MITLVHCRGTLECIVREYDLGRIDVHQRGRLPHWDAQHAVYFVTWHLADALPVEARERLRGERDLERRRIASTRGEMTPAEHQALQFAYELACESVLDAGHGKCIVRQAQCAEIVIRALRHFDGTRYQLYAWCVMPNHVHVVFTPGDGVGVSAILHSWKSFTSKELNKVLKSSGSVWQAETFDRCVRSPREFLAKVRYVLNNPANAELLEWPFVGSYPDRIGELL